MTFLQMRLANKRRCNTAFLGNKLKQWSPTDWACALAGEVGELCNFIKKQRRGDDVNMLDIEDEMADVLIYLDLLAARYNIDLEAVTVRKFNETSRKMGSKYKLDIDMLNRGRMMAEAGLPSFAEVNKSHADNLARRMGLTIKKRKRR